MLEVGGTIVIDDVGLQSVRKLVRYVLNYPAYKLIDSVKLNISKKRKLYHSFLIKPLKLGSKIFPAKVRNEIFQQSFLVSDKSLSVEASMVALQKVDEDNREWHWYKTF
jgi:hypothetical protein